MFCTNCGKEITGKFCIHCGAAQTSKAAPKPPAKAAPLPADVPMGWHKTLVNFLLFCSAALHLFYGLLHLTGGYWDFQGDLISARSLVNTVTIYTAFPSLETVDVIIGLGMLLAAALLLASRSKLRHLRANGPQWARNAFLFGGLLVLAYPLVAALVTDMPITSYFAVLDYLRIALCLALGLSTPVYYQSRQKYLS